MKPSPRRAPSPVRSAILAVLALSLLALFALVPTAGAASGDLAWQRVYDSPGNGNDGFWSTSPAPNGGVYVAGTRSVANSDFLVARYDAAGQRRWLRTYNGSGNVNDVALDAAADGNGNLVVVGYANGANMAVIKYGPGGQRRWVRLYDDLQSSEEQASDVAIDAAGNIYVTGYRIVTAAVDEIVLLKYSPAGARRWVRHYTGGMNADPTDIAVDAAGNTYVTGVSLSAGTGYDIVTLKYDPAGHRRWVRRWDGPAAGDDYVNAVAVTAAGTVYVAGNAPGTTSGQDAVVLKYGTGGAFKWSRFQTSPGAFQDAYYDLVLLENGDVVATGVLYGGADHGHDALLVRLSPAGQTRWARLYNGPDGMTEHGTRVARGPSGSVFVAGLSYSVTTSYDILTLKYGGTGAFRWARRYTGTGGFDQQTAAALTVSGGVYVAGSQDGISTDAVLLKYRP